MGLTELDPFLAERLFALARGAADCATFEDCLLAVARCRVRLTCVQGACCVRFDDSLTHKVSVGERCRAAACVLQRAARAQSRGAA